MRHVKRIMPAHMRACVRPMEDLSINSRLGALVVSQDASLIVVGLGRSVVVLRTEYFEERWLKGPNPNMSDRAIVVQLNNLENDVSVVQISANNATVIAAGKEENWAAALHVVDGSPDVSALYMTREAQIHGIALSPDGRFASMTGRDRKATVYDVSGTEWRLVYEFDLTVYLFAYGTCVQFAPAGDLLIVGGDMRKCTVWDVTPDKRLAAPASSAAATDADSRLVKVLGRGGYINAVCFDASGATLALTGGDWKVALYDVRNDFALIAEVVMPVQHQHGLAISFPSPPPPPGTPLPLSHPSGHPPFAGLILAAQSGRESGVLTLTDMATLCPLCELEGVNDVGFARGGLLFCKMGGAVHLYDINSAGDAIIPESRLGGRVRAMALNHDGSMIALARMAVVRVYASAHNGVVDELALPGDVVALAYSPHDTLSARIVSRLLDRHLIPHELHARIMHDSQLKGKLAALTAKRLLVFAGEAGALVKVASVALEFELPLKEEEARHGLRWSADGSLVAVATASHAVLVNTHTATVVATKQRETAAWFSVFRLRDEFGPHLAAGFGRGAFYRECDVKEKQLKALMQQLGVVRVQAYAMAHDCRHVAVGGNGSLFIFDTRTQEAVFQLANVGWVMGLVWSADDRFVGIGGHNKTVTVLDVSSGVVFADCGVPRSYWPLVLAFSADGRVVADGNQSFAVYSCDGSRLALCKPLEAAPMLRTSAPVWSGDDDGQAHQSLLVGLIRTHPQVALNGLPTKNDGIYKDKGLQPLDDGSARMLDVLIARHERALVGRLLEQVPALALLPASRTETPSFELAIRKRDLPTLHLLLVASCRAPLPLRQCVAHRLIPRLGAEGLGAAVGTFVCDAAVQLERSGALLDLACASTAELVYQLYPSWGGVGTRLWEAQVVVRDAAASPLPPGVHVRPKRVPLPGLTSSGALRVLVARATRICHRGHHLPVFESACVRAVVEALWRLQFERLNRLRLLGVLAHLGLVLAYAACAHELAGARAQPAVEGGASVAEAVLPYAHLLLASSLLMLNAPLLLAKLLDVGRGARGGGRPASRRHRVSSFGQDVPGCALLLCAVGYELFELNDARATAGPHCRAGLSLAVRAGLVASVARQCAAVVRALAGLPQLTLTVLSLLRAAGSVLPMVLGAALLCVVLLVTSPLVHGADAQQPSDRTVIYAGVALLCANAALHVCSNAYRELAPRRLSVELLAQARLILDYYECMSPAQRQSVEAAWEWVHVLESTPDPAYELQRRAPATSLRAVEERCYSRIEELEKRLESSRRLGEP